MSPSLTHLPSTSIGLDTTPRYVLVIFVVDSLSITHEKLLLTIIRLVFYPLHSVSVCLFINILTRAPPLTLNPCMLIFCPYHLNLIT